MHAYDASICVLVAEGTTRCVYICVYVCVFADLRSYTESQEHAHGYMCMLCMPLHIHILITVCMYVCSQIRIFARSKTISCANMIVPTVYTCV